MPVRGATHAHDKWICCAVCRTDESNNEIWARWTLAPNKYIIDRSHQAADREGRAGKPYAAPPEEHGK